ncbi:serine/threonine-protein kinase [Calothrix sp. 336/3]|uniref:serine/threonine-protein kinase n=1 Tax=Calothrix sp. 336/3 TaxID=1337936 RepID=UPI0004E2BBD2|nr:serine/threonine-protein kinase [Calothrix sp. 336/3]AKG20012.1 serine/threonine protein kinase [Calothrix sp. 336/3]
MTHNMIGKILQGRYQIVQTLGAGVFGQTYIAMDVEQPTNAKCVVKQLKVTSCQPSYLQTLRLHFLTETETLRHLGHHQQIPQLIACFEEHERFYLVQEFIEGYPLTAELPINQRLGYLWSESEVIDLLRDVLEILDFIHSQGVIHCDIKPENLIRRTDDGKLVLIDFGSIQPVDFAVDDVLPIYRVPATSLGYIPPEQFIGQTQPNSDIYSLGMVAIQALTGLSPLQLKIDPYTNEIIWRSPTTPVSDYLAAMLTQMIRYDYQQRFHSAAEVLRVIQQMSMDNWRPQTIPTQYSVIPNSPTSHQNSTPKRHKKLSPALTGMRVGLAANSLLLGFGVYSVLNSAPAYSETETLYKATKEFQSGDLEQAIALAKSIPTHSHVYPEVQATIEEWQNQWQLAAEQFNLAQKFADEGKWSEVLQSSAQVPDILYWQSKTDQLVERAKINIDIETKNLLRKAYDKAREKDFTTALNYLQQIPPESNAGAIVQQKITEYEQKQQVRSVFLLQNAYNKAASRDFAAASQYLQQIPKNSSVYATAQNKLREYTNKQGVAKQNQTEESLTSERQITPSTSAFIKSHTSTSLKSFDPGNYMREVNIQ